MSIKAVDLTKALESGKIAMVGTYWSGRIDVVNVRDKANPGGPRRQSHVVRETVMTETDPVTVTRWLRDGDKPDMWHPSSSKGKKVVVWVQSMSSENGMIKLGGHIEELV